MAAYRPTPVSRNFPAVKSYHSPWLQSNHDDWIKSVTWSGAEAPDYSFVKFDLIVSLPKLTGLQQIKIWQTYADGSVVAWVEDRSGENVKKPAAGLMLTETEEQ